MEVFMDWENKTIKIKFSGTAESLLKKLKINKEIVLVTRDNVLLSEDDKVTDKDKIKLLSVVSGG